MASGLPPIRIYGRETSPARFVSTTARTASGLHECQYSSVNGGVAFGDRKVGHEIGPGRSESLRLLSKAAQ